MRLSIIAILISLSAIAYGQQDTTKSDTIALSAAHAQLLPRLVREQAELEKALASVKYNIFILLTGYVDEEIVNAGKVSATADQRKIIVRH